VAAVLTSADTVLCAVGQGKVQSSGAPKLTVNSNPVLTVASVQGATVAGCVPKGQPAPPGCTNVASITSGISAKLLVSGSPALLTGMTATGAAAPPHAIGPAAGTQVKLDAL